MKFRKKPVVIDAEQFWPEKTPWPAGVFKVGGCLPGEEKSDLWFRIKTPEGESAVTKGDWIITGVKGEKYPCKPDIFEMTYDSIEEAKS